MFASPCNVRLCKHNACFYPLSPRGHSTNAFIRFYKNFTPASPPTLEFYRTSHSVRKSGNFSKSELSGNWTFSFLDVRLLKLLEIEKRKKEIQKKNQIFSSNLYSKKKNQIFSSNLFWLYTFLKRRSFNLMNFLIKFCYFVYKMFKTIGLDLVRSSRTCRRICVSSPVWSGNSYAQSGWTLTPTTAQLWAFYVITILCPIDQAWTFYWPLPSSSCPRSY